MSKTKIGSLSSRFGYGLLAVAMLFAYFPAMASAVQITNRKVVIGNSAPSAVTTYNFTFTVPTTGTPIKSASFTACTTASGTCTAPSNFSATAATLTSQPTGMGAAAGWTLSNTAGAFKLVNAANATNPSGSQTVSFTGATNPDSANATFFIRMATFSGSDWATGALDNGVVAASTAGVVTVNANVDETLTFTLAATTVPLGTINASTTGSGTSTMTVGTNGTYGYSVSYNPTTTLTSGANTITALASQTASQIGQKQFGINLRDNATPNVGSDKTGAAGGTVAANYNTADSFMFNTAGDVIATASGPVNTTTYTTSYIANVTTDTAAGAYSTSINYIATANF
jgi:hypothetical protein